MGALPHPDPAPLGNDSEGSTSLALVDRTCACGQPATQSYEFASGDRIDTCDHCRAARNIKVYDETTDERCYRLSHELRAWAHWVEAGLSMPRGR